MRVTEVKVIGPHQLHLRFSEGFEADLDLKALPTLYPNFERLKDQDAFASARVEANTAAWDNLDLCPDVLRAWCEAGRLLSKEETDRRFSNLEKQIVTTAK